MKKFTITLIGFITAITLASTSFAATTNTTKASQQPQVQSLDSIVAIVNKNIISQTQLQHQLALVKEDLKASNEPIPPDNVLAKQVLSQLINTQLVVEQANKLGITINNMQINQTIARIAAENHATVPELLNKVKQQGLSMSVYREQLKQQVMVEEVEQQALASKVHVTPQEINSYYNKISNQSQHVPEYHLKAILVPLPAAPSPAQVDAAQKKAAAIVSKLASGANFTKTAIAESAGTHALKGGDMGWRQTAQMPPALAKIIVDSQPGKVIGPVRSPTGYYIIKYVAKRTVPLRHYVEEFHVRSILVRLGSLTTGNQAKAQLKRYRQMIMQGQSFASIAEKYSQDAGSAAKGGNIGWLKISEMPLQLAETISRLQVGQVSEPIQTQKGYEIVQVVGRRKVNNTKTFLKNRIAEMIYQRKFQSQIASWIQQLRGDAYIKIMPPYNNA